MNKILMILLIIVVIVMTISPVKQQIIDLPEEYMAISRDSTNPDNLQGYFRNDTLFITFKPQP